MEGRIMGTRVSRLLRLQKDIISLEASLQKPDYNNRFKKWYPGQKERYDRQCKGFSLLIECINDTAQYIYELDLLDEVEQ